VKQKLLTVVSPVVAEALPPAIDDLYTDNDPTEGYNIKYRFNKIFKYIRI
jgi:hypothetical protein